MRPTFGVSLLVALACAPEAVADVVTIGSELRPDSVRVVAGTSVRWENTTATAQRVDSVGAPEFEDLDVPAGAGAERVFRRTGRYRYSVPGIGREGEVIVVAGRGRGGTRPSGRGCNRRETFLYDVHVSATKSASEFWNPEYKSQGQFSLDYAYTVRHRGVPVTVKRQCPGMAEITAQPGRAQPPGRGTLTKYLWSDSVQSQSDPDDTPPCNFNVTMGGLGAQLEVSGSLTGGRQGNYVAVTSRLREDQADALGAVLAARRDAVCDKGSLSNARVFDGLPGHDAAGGVPIFQAGYPTSGVKIDPPLTNLLGAFSGQRVSPPLKALAAGRSFTLNSGMKRYQGTNSQTTATASASVRIQFIRRRR